MKQTKKEENICEQILYFLSRQKKKKNMNSKYCNKIDKWKQQTNEKPRRHNEETFSVNLLNEYDENESHLMFGVGRWNFLVLNVNREKTFLIREKKNLWASCFSLVVKKKNTFIVNKIKKKWKSVD